MQLKYVHIFQGFMEKKSYFMVCVEYIQPIKILINSKMIMKTDFRNY